MARAGGKRGGGGFAAHVARLSCTTVVWQPPRKWVSLPGPVLARDLRVMPASVHTGCNSGRTCGACDSFATLKPAHAHAGAAVSCPGPTTRATPGGGPLCGRSRPRPLMPQHYPPGCRARPLVLCPGSPPVALHLHMHARYLLPRLLLAPLRQGREMGWQRGPRISARADHQGLQVGYQRRLRCRGCPTQPPPPTARRLLGPAQAAHQAPARRQTRHHRPTPRPPRRAPPASQTRPSGAGSGAEPPPGAGCARTAPRPARCGGPRPHRPRRRSAIRQAPRRPARRPPTPSPRRAR